MYLKKHLKGLASDEQKAKSLAMLRQIAEGCRTNVKAAMILLPDERACLRRCWNEGARIMSEYHKIETIWNRVYKNNNPTKRTGGPTDQRRPGQFWEK